MSDYRSQEIIYNIIFSANRPKRIFSYVNGHHAGQDTAGCDKPSHRGIIELIHSLEVQVPSLPGGLVHQIQCRVGNKLVQALLVIALVRGLGRVFQLEQRVVSVAHDHKVVATRHLSQRYRTVDSG
jgi:hypothetical protein